MANGDYCHIGLSGRLSSCIETGPGVGVGQLAENSAIHEGAPLRSVCPSSVQVLSATAGFALSGKRKR